MQRLDSLDFLRGWASVLVVISHLIGVFWVSQSGLEHLMGYQHIGEVSLPYMSWIIDKKLYFGQLGVAVFFLISGYVITLSLEKYNHFGFLMNRIIRIYPVYITGFIILIMSLHFIDFKQDGIPYSSKHLLIHSFIILRQWLDYQRIDGISWTLEIELYFYVVMFIVFQFRSKIRHIMIRLLIIIISLIVILSPFEWYEKRQLLMISYMLLGYYFYSVKQHYVSNWQFLLSLSIVLSTMFIFYNSNKPFSTHLADWYLPYLYAPLLFWIMLYKFENYKIDTFSKFLSKISYPLYVVHPIFGYAILVFLLKNGLNSWVALIMVLFVVFILSYLLHLYIEKPAIKYAQKFNHKKT